MYQDCRQSPLKALLNTFGMCQKTHIMATRYGSHGTEDVPATQDSAPLDLAPTEHPMHEEDNEFVWWILWRNLTLAAHLLSYWNSFSNLKTLLQAWNLPLSNLHPQQSWCSSQRNFSISPWGPKSAPSPVRNQCTKPYRHIPAPCTQHRENQTSPQPCSMISPHLMNRTPQS